MINVSRNLATKVDDRDKETGLWKVTTKMRELKPMKIEALIKRSTYSIVFSTSS
jgi:hypothetical protein